MRCSARLVARAAADEHRQLEAADEGLEVERLLVGLRATCSADTSGAWITSRSGSAFSRCFVSASTWPGDTATTHVAPVALISAMRASTSSGRDLGGVGVAEAATDLEVVVGRRRRPAPASSVGRVVVAGPQPLEVQDGAAADLGRATAAVAGDEMASLGAASTGAPKRKASISQVRSTFSASRVRRLGTMDDLVEAVGPAGRLAHADLDVGHSPRPPRGKRDTVGPALAGAPGFGRRRRMGSGTP